MTKKIIQAIDAFNVGSYGAAIELAQQIGRVSKDYRQAQQVLAASFYNLGVSQLMQWGDMTAAEQSFRQCLVAEPQHDEAHHNLAGILVLRFDLTSALQHYQTALKIKPQRDYSRYELALCYERLNQTEQAAVQYAELDSRQPHQLFPRLRRALLLKSIIPEVGYIATRRAEIAEHFSKLLVELKQPDTKPNANIHDPDKTNTPYFYLSYHGLSNHALNTQIAKTYLMAYPSLAWSAPRLTTLPKRSTGQRLRVGFLSEHLCNHSIGHTSRGLIAQVNRQEFEVIVIHLGVSRKDDVHEWINQHADRVVNVAPENGLQAAREQIAELDLHLAFWQDIGMAPFSYFLAFARLAPIHFTTFGHPDTTGIATMDYFLSSALYEPEDAQKDYSERLILVPDAPTLAYYYRPEPPAALTRENLGLPTEGNLYICPQTLFKFHPDMDQIFAEIYAQDQDAYFVLITPKEQWMAEQLSSRIVQSYPQLAHRLCWVQRIAEPDRYLALLKCANVMLDTIHFNGQNTNLEAFSLPLPVVTLPTGLQRGRHTLGMYRAMGWMDLVATSTAHYVQLACRVAQEPEFADYCKRSIAEKSNILYHNTAFVRDFEDCLWRMAEQGGAQ